MEAAKTQLVTAEGTNAFNVHCPSCKSLILKKGVAQKVDHQTAVELPLIPTQSPTKHSLAPTYNWSVSDMMAFENIGFTKPVPGSNSSSTRYLSCADCDVGPVGYHPTPAEGAGKVYLVAADRVRYRVV
ncbi:Mss4-like protein [Fimicolochytrium jonesii]|uniref:Mss4-like protein n=1 Tax=Fimicolochytrium jonesii TaxID=1396493 RepID=UPI0022FDD5D0|nr:Mss4-like protein [Fimicolochytrium jonesii]KAI8819885.1 Mss4-like protein [Fimicolochytrium jonesii]